MRFGLHHEIHQDATHTSGNITRGVAQQNKMVIGGAERSGVEACSGGGRRCGGRRWIDVKSLKASGVPLVALSLA
jgi:hypothetical protein